MKPVCVPCERFMHLKTSGMLFVEGKPTGADEPWDGEVGRHSVGWTGYKLWQGDLWHCPDCGSQVIVGVGLKPWAEHYQKEWLDAIAGVSLLVKDC